MGTPAVLQARPASLPVGAGRLGTGLGLAGQNLPAVHLEQLKKISGGLLLTLSPR